MDRSKFYKEIKRTGLIKTISQHQVDCMEKILDWSIREGLSLEQSAYCFATAWHETGQFKWLREIWGPTAQQKKYEPGTQLARDLGNVQKGDGKKFMGRGFVHITGRRNYSDWSKRLGKDLVKNPTLAEDKDVAAQILVQGCSLGTFTRRKLSDYINSTKKDYKEARRVVNGTDKADMIAGYADKFEKALKDAGYTLKSIEKPVQSIPVSSGSKTLETATPSVWSLIGDFLRNLFGGRNV